MVLYLDTKNKKYALPERKRVLFLENRARARERERERERERLRFAPEIGSEFLCVITQLLSYG